MSERVVHQVGNFVRKMDAQKALEQLVVTFALGSGRSAANGSGFARANARGFASERFDFFPRKRVFQDIVTVLLPKTGDFLALRGRKRREIRCRR